MQMAGTDWTGGCWGEVYETEDLVRFKWKTLWDLTTLVSMELGWDVLLEVHQMIIFHSKNQNWAAVGNGNKVKLPCLETVHPPTVTKYISCAYLKNFTFGKRKLTFEL